MKSEYYGGLVPVKSRCGVGMSFHLNFQRKGGKMKGKKARKRDCTNRARRQSIKFT